MLDPRVFKTLCNSKTKQQKLSSGQGQFSSQQLEATGVKQHLRLKEYLFPYISLRSLCWYKARAIDVNGTVGLATWREVEE